VLTRFAGVLGLLLVLPAAAAPSQCYGSVSHGRIEGSVKLPASGANFSAYSSIGVALGRTFVHSSVADIVTKAYADLGKTAPDQAWVYGETGAKGGGPFKPHRSHQNGLSLDFFVPVRGADGKAAVLPMHALNRFGYGLQFDSAGVLGDYRIDFDAMAEHLFQLDASARSYKLALGRVIIERQYLPMLFATSRGPYLRKNLTFMKTEPWVRHDEHYHVDFAVPCKKT
jgi:penicillin-insensitive murein endopeptidase